MALVVRRNDDWSVVNPGDEITDFRGERYALVYATRARTVMGSGKMVVKARDKAGRDREFYDNVFGVTVTEK